MFYYLPKYDTEERPMPWARTHFNPTLEVEIAGFDIETEKALRDLTIDYKGKLLGSWLIEGVCIALVSEDAGTVPNRKFRT
jgi:hypothetical protein